MEKIILFDSELRLMEIIWIKAPVSAKALSLIATEEIGWNKNTTYTVLKKLVEKKAVERNLLLYKIYVRKVLAQAPAPASVPADPSE